MRRIAVILAVAAAAIGPAIAPASAQSYAVVDSVRLPAESYVGDAVELRYSIRSDAALRTPAPLPQPGWGTIESIRIVERESATDVRIAVVPFEPGTLTLPRLDLGEVALEGLSLVVASILEPDAQLRSIYGPQRLPGTRLAIFLVVAGVVVPGVLALYLAGPGRQLVARIVAYHRARVPYRNLRRTMDRLEANINRESAREFYTALVGSLQDLMTSRLGFDCRAATSTELAAYLPALAARCAADARTAAPLAVVFETSDAAKFAHGQVRRKVRAGHLAVCRSVTAELESSRRARGRSGLRSTGGAAAAREASRVGP